MTPKQELAKLKAHLAGVKATLEETIRTHKAKEQEWFQIRKSCLDFGDKNHYAGLENKEKAVYQAAEKFLALLEPPSDG